MPKVTKPAQILNTALNQLKGLITTAMNTGKSPQEQVIVLKQAVSTYKVAMDTFKESVIVHHPKYKEVDGLRVLADDKLQNKLYAVQELGAKAQRLQNEAEVAAKEELAKKQQEQQVALKALDAAQKIAEEKAQAAKAATQKAAETILKKVDAILWDLYSKKAEIGNHLPEARELADTLYNTLTEARDEYDYQLKNGMTYDNKPISFDEAGDLFKDTCDAAIESAMPVLERDVSWGDYLKNVLKSIINALVYVATFGYKSNFFAYNKPSADKFTAVNEQLQDIDVSAPSFK